MASHNLHASIHEEGLADDCPRCAEIASSPFDGLDGGNMENLIAMVVSDEPPRSENERLAMYKVQGAMRLARALSRGGWEASA